MNIRMLHFAMGSLNSRSESKEFSNMTTGYFCGMRKGLLKYS